MEQVTFRVTGMDCSACERSIQNALGRVDGVRRSSADHQNGAVRVAFDPAKTTADALRECVEQAGFTVAGEAEASS